MLYNYKSHILKICIVYDRLSLNVELEFQNNTLNTTMLSEVAITLLIVQIVRRALLTLCCYGQLKRKWGQLHIQVVISNPRLTVTSALLTIAFQGN